MDVSGCRKMTWVRDGEMRKKEDNNSSGDEIANVNFCTTTTYM